MLIANSSGRYAVHLCGPCTLHLYDSAALVAIYHASTEVIHCSFSSLDCLAIVTDSQVFCLHLPKALVPNRSAKRQRSSSGRNVGETSIYTLPTPVEHIFLSQIKGAALPDDVKPSNSRCTCAGANLLFVVGSQGNELKYTCAALKPDITTVSPSGPSATLRKGESVTCCSIINVELESVSRPLLLSLFKGDLQPTKLLLMVGTSSGRVLALPHTASAKASCCVEMNGPVEFFSTTYLDTGPTQNQSRSPKEHNTLVAVSQFGDVVIRTPWHHRHFTLPTAVTSVALSASVLIVSQGGVLSVIPLVQRLTKMGRQQSSITETPLPVETWHTDVTEFLRPQCHHITYRELNGLCVTIDKSTEVIVMAACQDSDVMTWPLSQLVVQVAGGGDGVAQDVGEGVESGNKGSIDMEMDAKDAEAEIRYLLSAIQKLDIETQTQRRVSDDILLEIEQLNAVLQLWKALVPSQGPPQDSMSSKNEMACTHKNGQKDNPEWIHATISIHTTPRTMPNTFGTIDVASGSLHALGTHLSMMPTPFHVSLDIQNGSPFAFHPTWWSLMFACDHTSPGLPEDSVAACAFPNLPDQPLDSYFFSYSTPFALDLNGKCRYTIPLGNIPWHHSHCLASLYLIFTPSDSTPLRFTLKRQHINALDFFQVHPTPSPVTASTFPGRQTIVASLLSSNAHQKNFIPTSLHQVSSQAPPKFTRKITLSMPLAIPQMTHLWAYLLSSSSAHQGSPVDHNVSIGDGDWGSSVVVDALEGGLVGCKLASQQKNVVDLVVDGESSMAVDCVLAGIVANVATLHRMQLGTGKKFTTHENSHDKAQTLCKSMLRTLQCYQNLDTSDNGSLRDRLAEVYAMATKLCPLKETIVADDTKDAMLSGIENGAISASASALPLLAKLGMLGQTLALEASGQG